MAAALAAQFIVGSRHGRLVVVEHAGRATNRSLLVTCRCDCGQIKTVRASNIRGGSTMSCGCLAREMNEAKGTHRHRAKGHASPEYVSWRAMVSRCTNPKSPGYENYGGRGISVCKRWLSSFENFLDDMGNRPSPSHTIDRKNNDGNYSKRNCQWATKSQQSRNSRWVVLSMGKARKVRRLVAEGMRISDAARLLNIKYGSAWQIASGKQWREDA